MTKIIRNIFAILFVEERIGMRNTINTNNHTRTTASALWSTFIFIGSVQEFLKYDVKNHTSIATSYVILTTYHLSMGKVNTLSMIL